MAHYLDTSALVKLVVAESETVALRLGDDLDSIVTYDERQADAARQNGIVITAPE